MISRQRNVFILEADDAHMLCEKRHSILRIQTNKLSLRDQNP